MNVKLAVRRLAHASDLPLPQYHSAQAAGLDLVAALGVAETLVLEPGARARIPSGLAVHLPTGYEAQVRPRSGLAISHGVTVLNTPGTIDADYRGEIGVILVNLGREPFEISRGQRIAQLVVTPVARAELIEVASLDETVRGAAGFGSTGNDSG